MKDAPQYQRVFSIASDVVQTYSTLETIPRSQRISVGLQTYSIKSPSDT